MTIFDDAEQGKLDKYKLEQYIKDGVAIDGVDPSTNLTALGLAIKNDRVNATKLLIDNGAKPDVPLNPDGRTPIYLAASAKGNRPRLVQTLLPLTPQTFDQPIPSFENETPLFPAVRLRDANTVRLLVEDGASLDKKNAKGQTVQEIADLLNDQAVKDALKAVPKKRRGGMRTLFDSFALKVLAWFGIWKPFQKIWGAAADTFYGIASPTGVRPGKNVPEPKTAADFKQNLDNIVDRNGLERFFPPGNPYVQEVAEKAATLKDSPENFLNTPEQIQWLATLALYQPVLYCDDSGSMGWDNEGERINETRWVSQSKLVKRITNITNRAVPGNGGIHLRFINNDTPKAENLSGDAVERTIQSLRPYNDTPLGTNLRSHVLKPLIYDDLESRKPLKRPYLILITTDGIPNEEVRPDQFRESILECGKKLEEYHYRSDAVTFCLSQIGTNEESKNFMKSLEFDIALSTRLHRTAELLDVRFNQLRGNEKDIEAWLLGVLLSPLPQLNK